MTRALIFLLVFAGSLSAACQTTSVTSSSGGLVINSAPVNGTLTISSQGPVAVSGGGLHLPSASSSYIAQCKVSAGAISGSCVVPDSALSNGGNGVLYSVLITDQFAGKAQLLANVSISGTTWALDQYVPPSTVVTPGFTYTTGSGAPSGSCSASSLYGDTSGSTLAFYGCKAGAWTSIGGGTGGSMIWPSGGDAIPHYNGTQGWGSSYTASNKIPASLISTLNQDTTGNANTATTANALASAAWQAPGAIGATTPNTGNFTHATANDVSTNGPGAGTHSYVAGAAPASIPANAVTEGAPATVTSAYYEPKIGAPPTNDGNNYVKNCKVTSTSPYIALTCTWVQPTTSSSNLFGAQFCQSGNYTTLTFNANCADGTRLGMVAGNAASGDPNLYIDVPSGGRIVPRSGGTATFGFPTSTPTGTQTLFCTFTSGQVVCNYGNGANLAGASFSNLSGYTSFTLNANHADGSRLGFIGGGAGDPNLYLDVPAGGSFIPRIANTPLPSGSFTAGACTVTVTHGLITAMTGTC